MHRAVDTGLPPSWPEPRLLLHGPQCVGPCGSHLGVIFEPQGPFLLGGSPVTANESQACLKVGADVPTLLLVQKNREQPQTPSPTSHASLVFKVHQRVGGW